MKIFNIITALLLSCVILAADAAAQSPSAENSDTGGSEKKESAKRRISWELAEGADEYKVQIRNMEGKILVEKNVKENYFDVELPYGNYKIRIGAVNKFRKVGTWSDWANFNIAKKTERREETLLSYSPMLFKIGFGPSYFRLLPNWDDLYKNSFKATTMHISAAPLDFSYFRYAGLELEGIFVRFESRSKKWRIETEMTNIITGCSLFATSWFDSPLNLILRLGGGIVYTRQEYEKFNSSNPSEKSTAVLKSQDTYYRAGISIEYRITKNLFLEGGADYYIIRYITSDLKGINYYVMIGTGL